MLHATELITSLVDWINITLVMDDGGVLLQLLCEMMSLTTDVQLQLVAVDCLLALTNRKVDFQHLIIVQSLTLCSFCCIR